MNKTEYKILLGSGLVDAKYYNDKNEDVRRAGADPVLHYSRHGWEEGRWPNRYFDPVWYAEAYLHQKENPLTHYVRLGEASGFRPIAHFEPEWYRRRYNIGKKNNCLKDFLENVNSCRRSPNQYFDIDSYVSYARIKSGTDAFGHYIECDNGLDIEVGANFDTAKYRNDCMPIDFEREGRRSHVLLYRLGSEGRQQAGLPPIPMSISEESVKECGRIYALGGPDAEEIVDRLANYPAYSLALYRVAYVLRRYHHPSMARDILSRFTHDSYRVGTCKELMYIAAEDGQFEESLTHFNQLEKNAEAGTQETLLGAWTLARLSRFEDANSVLYRLYRACPTARQECRASSQFFEFYRAFPKEVAEQMLERVNEKFKRPGVESIERDIVCALNERRPYLLLRLGDGEGSYTKISNDDEMRYIDLYDSNRQEFLDIWFKDKTLIDDPELDRVMTHYDAAIRDADFIGGLYPAAIENEYRIGSRRGIAWVINTLRKVLKIAEESPGWAERTSVGELGVHYQLLLSGCLGRLLQGRGFLGLISCHSTLPEALQNKFGVKDVEFHKVPGEKIHGAELGGVAVEGTHWPDRYLDLTAELSRTSDRQGQLFLVAAGILGKIYAAQLKNAGAVVIDIGAVADLWMGKQTRTFPDLPEELKL